MVSRAGHEAAGFVVGVRVRVRADAAIPRFGVTYRRGSEGVVERVGGRLTVRFAGAGVYGIRRRDLDVIPVRSDLLRRLDRSPERDDTKNMNNKTNAALVQALETVTADRDALAAELEAKDAMIRELAAYLGSDKFRTDTTVQVRDVLARLGAR